MLRSMTTIATAIAIATPVAAQQHDPADVATLDGIIEAFYDVVSGPAGERPDRERDRYLHHPDALVGMVVIRDGKPAIRSMSLDEYHDAFGGARTAPFYEWELHRTVQRFGAITHVWSTYASSRTPRGEIFARGINSIQLFHDGDRWWIMGWIFDSEREGNPLPG